MSYEYSYETYGQLSRDKVSPDKLLITSRLIFRVLTENEQEKAVISQLNRSDTSFLGIYLAKLVD